MPIVHILFYYVAVQEQFGKNTWMSKYWKIKLILYIATLSLHVQQFRSVSL